MFELTKRFIASPRTVGAIWPSSPTLAREIVGAGSLDGVVVEIGAGTGAFTGEISARLAPDAQFVAIEIDKAMFTVLRQRYPEINARQRCATELANILTEEGLSKPNTIISGIPWASLPSGTQDKLLDSIHANLRPGGVFATFAYLQAFFLPAAKRFRQKVDTKFARVERGLVVWKNIPPAFVYRCVK